MGILNDRLDALTVRAGSPDGRITGVLSNRTTVSLSFVDDKAYGEYTSEQEIASQLSAVIHGLLAGRLAAQQEAIEKFTSLRIDDGQHWDAAKRRFRSERDNAKLRGDSRDEWISVTSTAMRDAKVTVAPGALAELDAGGLLAEVETAIRDLWLDWKLAKQVLRAQHFGRAAH